MGGMKATSTAKATVAQSPEHVWSVLSDHEGMSHWAPGLRAVLKREGTSERNGVGAVRSIGAAGPIPPIVEEIVEFEPGKRLVYKALSGVPFKDYFGTVELRPSGTGTEISYTVSVARRLPGVEKAAATGVAHTLLKMLVRRSRATA
jgi:uncharacterized protein YndB with AHSA1/START domain